jgi:hypothetical protein
MAKKPKRETVFGHRDDAVGLNGLRTMGNDGWMNDPLIASRV